MRERETITYLIYIMCSNSKRINMFKKVSNFSLYLSPHRVAHLRVTSILILLICIFPGKLFSHANMHICYKVYTCVYIICIHNFKCSFMLYIIYMHIHVSFSFSSHKCVSKSVSLFPTVP